MSQKIKDSELQSVTEEEEDEDNSQAGSELEIDKKKKEKKPLKSALKSKSKSKTSKKTKNVETKDLSKPKEKGLNRVSSVQTISSVVADLDNLSQEISRTFYKTPNYSSHSTQTSYQTPQFYHDQTPDMYHRAQAREEQYRNNFRDLNIESYHEHRRSDYENSNRFFSQSVQPQQFNHSHRQREYQQEYLPPIQQREYQQEYLPPIQQRMPMHYSQQFEQPYQEREHWNNDFYKSHTSFASTKSSRDYRFESEYSAAPPSSQYQDYGYATRDTFLSAPQKLDIRSLYKNKPKHIMMEQDSELRNGLKPNSLIRPPQTTQNYRTKSMIPSASAIHIHRGI